MSRILIVEDYRNLLRSLKRGLESQGYEILTAESGEEGYPLAMTQNVDAVILDIMLSGKSGFDVLHDLRQNGFSGPILILTARDSPEDRERGRQYGADCYLVKPFAFEDLIIRLGQLLGHTRPDT